MTLYSFDTETRLISRGIDAAPQIVCVTYCAEDLISNILHHSEAEDFVWELYDRHEIVGANTAFDSCCVLRSFPRCKEAVFKAYREGRVHDTQNAQRLIDLAQGCLNGYRHASGVFIEYRYNLAELYKRYNLGTLEKGVDTWRLRYGELIDVPMSQWPEEAKSYALLDAKATLQVWLAQQEFKEFLKDEPAQTRKHQHLQLKTVCGIKSDAKTCDLYMEETKAELARCEALLKQHGLIRGEIDPVTGKKNPKSKIGTKDTARAKELMKAACLELDIEPKLTETGEISLDAEMTRDTGHPVLKAYSMFTSSATILKKVADIKLGSGEFPLQTEFNPIVENGRSSARKPRANGSPTGMVGVQIYNLPRSGRMRNCLVPRPGKALISLDFNMHELVTVSQCQIWLTGSSKLAEALNANRDVHCDVGAILANCTYEEMMAKRKIKGSVWEQARQQSKEVNFGGWGGMTAKRLRLQMNKKRREGEALVTQERAEFIMQAWKERWEPESYFEAVTAMFPDHNPWSRATITQFISGRVRGLIDYPAALNTLFSGLAADASADADCVTSEACYLAGPSDPLWEARPLFHLYDEWVGEVRLDRLTEAAKQITELFVGTAQKYTPDVKLTAEPAAMSCYDKNAETIWKNGELLVWSPNT